MARPPPPRGRQVLPPQGVPPPPVDLYTFRSRRCAELWDSHYRFRQVEPGKHVELRDTRAFRLEEHYTSVGWRPILTYDLPCYTTLVQYFYCNLRVDWVGDEYTLTSRVRGVDMVLTRQILADILGISNGGELTYVAPRTGFGQMLDPETYAGILEGLCGERKGTSITEKDMLPPARMISRVIQINVLPRSGHRNAVTPFQAYLTFCMLHRHEVNLPYIILRTMSHAVRSSSAGNLPYGLLLSRIFRHFGVNLTETLSEPIQTLDFFTVTRMGIHRYVASDSEHSGDDPPVRHRPERGQGSGAGTSSQPQGSSQPGSSAGTDESLRAMQRMLETITSDIGALGRQVSTSVDGLGERVDAAVESIASLRAHTDERLTELYQYVGQQVGETFHYVGARHDATIGSMTQLILGVDQRLTGVASRVDTVAQELSQFRRSCEEGTSVIDCRGPVPPHFSQDPGAPSSDFPPAE